MPATAPERRTFQLGGVEVRNDPGRPPRIIGHAAVYNQWSEDLGGFKERVLPGAFTRSLQHADVRALFNHDPNFVLGRTASGTLRLKDEARGLHIEATPPDTQTIRDLVLEPMRRGDVDQMSFSFQPIRDTWRPARVAGGLQERDLVEVELYDVSPVTFPAYEQTDVALRGRGEIADLVAAIAALRRGTDVTGLERGRVEQARAYLRNLFAERRVDGGIAQSRGDLQRQLEAREAAARHGDALSRADLAVAWAQRVRCEPQHEGEVVYRDLPEGFVEPGDRRFVSDLVRRHSEVLGITPPSRPLGGA